MGKALVMGFIGSFGRILEHQGRFGAPLKTVWKERIFLLTSPCETFLPGYDGKAIYSNRSIDRAGE
jgi:hypothetical protein